MASEKSDAPEKPVTPQPPPASDILNLICIVRGGVVMTSDAAQRVGEALVVEQYGEAELARQKPLLAMDHGDCWRVEGSFNRGYKLAGDGWFFATIWKYDGRVIDLGRWGPQIPLTPEVRKIIEEHQHRQQTEQSE